MCPLYAALPPGQQAKIFQSTPKGTRKCILATNIAETSITIPGVKYVIDTGKCKEKRHIARTVGSGKFHGNVYSCKYSNEIAGFDTLLTRDITKSSAMQRTGRAGREVSTSAEVLETTLITFLGSRILFPFIHGGGFQLHAHVC